MGRRMGTVLTIVLVLISGFIIANADTLMKGKHPIVIGWGTLTGSQIEWTDCERTQSAKYAKPPYWIDKNKNCDMTPQAFGIGEREKGKYVVIDPKNFGAYFPGALKGDEVFFERQGNRVVLRMKGQSLELRSAIWKGDESDSLEQAVAISDRWEGVVVRNDKDSFSLTVRKTGTNVEKIVRYDSSTRWVSQEHGSKTVSEADHAEVKDGDRVVCVGRLDKDGVFHATLISKRLSQ
jgi:hypothetical protein